MQVAGVIRFKFIYNNRLGYSNDLIIFNFNVGYKGNNITEDIINYFIISKLLIYSIDIVVRFIYIQFQSYNK